MKMLADRRQIANGLDEPPCRVTGMRAGETYALNPGHAAHGLEQLGEVAPGIVRSSVMIHDLPQQLNLLPPGVNRVSDLREDVGLRAHPLVSADRKSTRLNSSHVAISYAVF